MELSAHAGRLDCQNGLAAFLVFLAELKNINVVKDYRLVCQDSRIALDRRQKEIRVPEVTVQSLDDDEPALTTQSISLFLSGMAERGCRPRMVSLKWSAIGELLSRQQTAAQLLCQLRGAGHMTEKLHLEAPYLSPSVVDAIASVFSNLQRLKLWELDSEAVDDNTLASSLQRLLGSDPTPAAAGSSGLTGLTTQLASLSLERCNTQRLPETWITLGRLRQLRDLKVNAAGPTALAHVESWTQLTKLSLRLAAALPANLGSQLSHLTQLRTLELFFSHNQPDEAELAVLRLALPPLTNLTSLTLDSPYPIPGSLLTTLTGLQHLDLCGTLILDDPPGALLGLSQLTTIEVMGFKLKAPELGPPQRVLPPCLQTLVVEDEQDLQVLGSLLLPETVTDVVLTYHFFDVCEYCIPGTFADEDDFALLPDGEVTLCNALQLVARDRSITRISVRFEDPTCFLQGRRVGLDGRRRSKQSHAGWLSQLRLLPLTSLRLEGLILNAADVKAMATGLTELQDLDLQDCSLTEEVTEAKLRGLMPSLLTLELPAATPPESSLDDSYSDDMNFDDVFYDGDDDDVSMWDSDVDVYPF